MFEVAWKEFNKSGRIVCKRKSFATQKALEKFIEKLYNSDNLYEIYGISS